MMLDEGHELHGHAAPLRTRLQPLPERSLPDECDPNVEAAEELRDRVDQGLEVLLRGQSPDVEDVLDRHRRMRRRTEEARVHAVRDEIHLGGSDLPDDERAQRSEEHTSELQSQSNLVCRLLLEKKKTRTELIS